MFALGVALVRLWPERWPALTGGVIGAALVICGYAVLTKVFPGALSADETYARLREPFGYWNSVGLMAAMAAPACLWLGARRSGHAALNALAYPALGLLVVACLLAYSRGSLLAMGAGCAVWFAVVPLRLRGASVFGIGGLGGLFVGLWAFGQDALSNDRVPLDERTAAGHELGVLLVVMLAILLVAGLAVNFALAERAPSLAARRRAGAVVAACVALLPIVLAGSLALSERGLGGSISKAWDDLTNPAASTPANDPTRLTAIGSVRARYWNEALQIWEANKAVGVGAGGYRTARPRYRDDTLNVRHAHGYLVQTMADLGLVGLAVSLALLAAWLAGAARTTGPWRGPARATFTPERIGLLTMCAVVVVFGVHSLIDWTWFVPGNVVPALLCAGWVAGRGPLTEPVGVRRPWRERLRALGPPAGGRRRRRGGHRRGRRGRLGDVRSAALGQRRQRRARGARGRPRARGPRRYPPRAQRRSAVDQPAVRGVDGRAVRRQRPGRAAAARGGGATAPVDRRAVAAPGAVRARPRPPAGRPAADRPGAVPRSALGHGPGDLARGQPPGDRTAQTPPPSASAAPARAALAGQRAQRAEACRARRSSGGPPTRPHLEVTEARLGEDLAQRSRGEEAQVVGARIEVLVESSHGERDQAARPWYGVVTRIRPPQSSTRRTSASSPTTSATCSSTSPAHTTSNSSSPNGSRAPSATCCTSASGARSQGAPHGLGGDVDGRHAAAGSHELGGERPVAAAEVEHAIAGVHVVEQERAALGEALGLDVLGHRPPHRLAPRVHGVQSGRWERTVRAGAPLPFADR